MTREPAPGEVHLWSADPTDPALPLGEYLRWLTPAERERADRFAAAIHRREYLVTRGLVRSVLSEYRPTPPGAWRFETNEYGKPRLAPASELHFNLSNTPKLVVCAVSTTGPIGVDVEPFHRAGLIAEVAESVFSPAELEDLAALRPEAQDARRLELWTLKEAYIKARGLGLALPLDKFSWRFGADGGLRLEIDPSLGDQPNHWGFTRFQRAGHLGALVAEGREIAELRVFDRVPGLSGPR